MIRVLNPYTGKTFIGFFVVFFQRMKDRVFGQSLPLVSDEIQALTLSLIALSCALLGTLLVLKKMTMLANSLSHTLLLGLVLATLFLLPFLSASEVHTYQLSLKVLLLASLLTALLTSLLTQFLIQWLHLREDASIGLVFTTLFALGILLVTLFTRNTHLGTEAVMGNCDALHLHDLHLVSWIALLDVAAVLLFYKEFKINLFDPSFATAQGFSSSLLHTFLMLLTAATVIGAFRAVGVLLVLSLLICPVLTARLLAKRFKTVIVWAILIGLVTSLCSSALSRHILSVYHTPVSTSGLMVTLLGTLYLSLAIWKSLTFQKKSC